MTRQADLFHADALDMTDDELRDSWRTPEWMWRPCLEVLSGLDAFDADLATNAWSEIPARAKFTRERSAFDHEWPGGVLWCNPPYSTEPCDEFFALIHARTRGTARLVCGVVPVATETKRWREHGPDYAILIGRAAFVPPPGIVASSPNNREHAIVVWGQPPHGAMDALALRIGQALGRSPYLCVRSAA